MVVLSAKRKIFPNRVTKFWLALATQKERNKIWTEFDMACLRLLLAGTASFPCLEYALLSPLLAMTFCHRKKCEIRYSNERSASTNSKEEFKTAWLYLYVHLYLDKFIGEKGNVELSEWREAWFWVNWSKGKVPARKVGWFFDHAWLWRRVWGGRGRGGIKVNTNTPHLSIFHGPPDQRWNLRDTGAQTVCWHFLWSMCTD